MTRTHSIDVIRSTLWKSGIWLGLATTAMLAAGCGGSSSSADGASAQVTNAQFIADSAHIRSVERSSRGIACVKIPLATERRLLSLLYSRAKAHSV
jgi:hypothetical protein